MVIKVKWRLESSQAMLPVRYYSTFIYTILRSAACMLFLSLLFTSFNSLNAQDHFSSYNPSLDPDPSAEAQLRLSSGNNLTGSTRSLPKNEGTSGGLLTSSTLSNLEVLSRQTRANTRKRASAASAIEDSGTTPMTSSLSSSANSNLEANMDSPADSTGLRDEPATGKGSRSRRKKRPNVSRREGLDDSLDDLDDFDEDEELERSAKKRRLFRLRNKNTTTTTTTSPITPTSTPSSTTSTSTSSTTTTTDKLAKKPPLSSGTTEIPSGNSTTSVNQQHQRQQHKSSTPASLFQDNKKKSGSSLVGPSLLDHEYYDDEDDEITTMKATTETNPSRKPVPVNMGMLDIPDKSKLNDTINQLNGTSTQSSMSMELSSLIDGSNLTSTTMALPLNSTPAENSSQAGKQTLSSTFFFFFFPPTTGTGGNSSFLPTNSPFSIARDQAVFGAGLFSNSSSMNLSSPKAFSLPANFLNLTRPWSSSIDLSTLPSINANESFVTVQTTKLSPEISGQVKGNNSTINTLGINEQDKLPSNKQLSTQNPNDSYTDNTGTSKAAASDNNNKGSNGIIELVKGTIGEHAKLQSSIKEQAQSLRHFIVVCSVSVVLAVSLVVGLIILLTK